MKVTDIYAKLCTLKIFLKNLAAKCSVVELIILRPPLYKNLYIYIYLYLYVYFHIWQN